MKKIFFSVFFLLVGFSAFSQAIRRNAFAGVGLALPVTAGKINDVDFKTFGVSLDIHCVVIESSGLVWLMDGQIGGAGANQLDDYKKIGFQIQILGGAGYALIKKSNMFLAASIVAGLDSFWWSFTVDKSYRKTDEWLMAYAFDIGPDIYFSYRFHKNLSAFVDLKLLGAFGIGVSTSTSVGMDGGMASFLFKPSAGVCMFF